MAGVGPGDIDLAEVHDCFTFAEIQHYEDMGFCKMGEGGRFVGEGRANLDGGKVVVNPSGGLLAKGHPLGATGPGQVYEVTQQLRGNCGKRQVKDARLGITQNGGGFRHGDTGVVHCFLLEKIA
jgi:acetyl-CoA acetyltransferase